MIKSNIGSKTAPIGYKVDENGVHFGKATEPRKTISQRDEVTSFLGTMLQDGPDEANAIIEKVAKLGIKKRTLDSVKGEMGISIHKIGGQKGKWIWTKEDR